MTITMTSKHQLTIPKKITAILSLKKGAMFDITMRRNRIALIPVETVERTLTDEEYEKLEVLTSAERGDEKPVTNVFVHALKTAKD